MEGRRPQQEDHRTGSWYPGIQLKASDGGRLGLVGAERKSFGCELPWSVQLRGGEGKAGGDLASVFVISLCFTYREEMLTQIVMTPF